MSVISEPDEQRRGRPMDETDRRIRDILQDMADDLGVMADAVRQLSSRNQVDPGVGEMVALSIEESQDKVVALGSVLKRNKREDW
jgi:hypothetical protein